MFRKLFIAGLVMALCSFALAGRASARARDIGYDDLKAVLVNESDLSGTGLSFVSDQNQDLGSGLIQVIRLFTQPADGGPAVAVVSLIARTDGGSLSSLRNQVAGGDLLGSAASGAGAQASSLTLDGSQGIGDLDQSAEFDSVISGLSYHFYGDVFLSGNVIGVVLYGAPAGQTDVNVANAIVQAQDAKLP